jgi:hypothetical protein
MPQTTTKYKDGTSVTKTTDNTGKVTHVEIKDANGSTEYDMTKGSAQKKDKDGKPVGNPTNAVGPNPPNGKEWTFDESTPNKIKTRTIRVRGNGDVEETESDGTKAVKTTYKATGKEVDKGDGKPPEKIDVKPAATPSGSNPKR